MKVGFYALAVLFVGVGIVYGWSTEAVHEEIRAGVILLIGWLFFGLGRVEHIIELMEDKNE